MALRAGYKGIKKYVADMLNKMNPGDSFATDAEIATAVNGVTDLMEDTVGWLSSKNLSIPYNYTRTTDNLTVIYEDNKVVVNGSTGNSDVSYPISSVARENGFVFTLSAGTYTVSLSGDTANIVPQIIKSDGTTYISSIITLDTETEVFIRVGVLKNSVFDNQTCYIQLEKGSTATSYEPYHASVKESLEQKADISALGTQEGATASKLYHPGEHFYKDGKFCTVIGSSDVALGTTWTLNTNYTEGDVADALKIEDISASFYTSLGTNWSLSSNNNVFKQGRRIFGDLVLVKSEALSIVQEVAIKLANKPVKVINTGCYVSDDLWNTKGVGYMYISNSSGDIIVKTDTADMTIVKVHLDYVY